jgi:hypothetical protein
MSEPASAPVEHSTTAMGSWYATVAVLKPQVALFVNESTLLPVLTPLAPAATVIDRFPAAVERSTTSAALLQGSRPGTEVIT